MKKAYKEAYKVLWVTIIINIFLGTDKLLVGLASGSEVVLSDGIHSYADVAATLVAVLALKISTREADERHPYGYEIYEPVFAAILSTALMLTGVAVAYKNIKILSGGSFDLVPGQKAFVVTVISIAIKEAMFWYTLRAARRIRSLTMETDAWHHRADAISSVAALIGLFLTRMGYKYMDSVAAVIVSALIIKIGFRYLLKAVNMLVDRAADPITTARAETVARAIPGVREIRDIKSRIFGNRIYIDIIIKVDGNASVAEGHEIAGKVKAEVEEQIEECKDCLVHVEPYYKVEA